MRLFKYAEIYRVQFKNNWVREAVYRTNFVTAVMVDLVWIAVEMSLFKVLYANTPTLAGWTQNQVFFFLGVFFASDALFTTFFQRNFWNFSDLVNKGELDILLTKPVSPVFLALSRNINITALLNFSLGILICLKFGPSAGFKGGWAWLTLLFWMGIGVLVALLSRFFFCVWIFWTDRTWALSRMYYQFFTFATKPDTIYPKAIRYLILTALPFAFIGSIPARAVITDLGLGSLEILCLAGVIVFFSLVNTTLWKRGLLRYQSASS